MRQPDQVSDFISGAWADVLQTFGVRTREKLLIASPWVKLTAARLLFSSLPSDPGPEIYLIARLELDDFLSGATDLELFYPVGDHPIGNVNVRALRNLHAKFLVSDDSQLILGSANLTEGGLCRNQEALIMSRDSILVKAAQSLFWDWWNDAAEVNSSYFSWVHEELLSLTPPEVEEGIHVRHVETKKSHVSSGRQPLSIPWITPSGAKKVGQKLAAIRNSMRVIPVTRKADVLQNTRQALAWLERRSRWIPSTERETSDFVELFNGYIHHMDENVRAVAVDRVGRLRITALQPTLRKFLNNKRELPSVRAASAFALTLLGDPASFGDLLQASHESGYIGRWARRGCFMLLSRVDSEQRQWFLHSLNIELSAELDSLISQIHADTGTNSVRLAKALVLEMLGRGEWNEVCLDIVAYSVFELGRRLSTSKSKVRGYGEFIKATAALLRVTPGDLKHGILSIGFVHTVWDGGWPDGLGECFGDRWRTLQDNRDLFITRLQGSAKLDSLDAALTK